MLHIISRWGFVLCALVLACALPPVIREGWRSTEGSAALLAAGVESFAELGDLTAEAEIELRQGKVRERGTALLQVVNPDLFRVEVRGLFFTHIFTALLEGDSLTVYGRAVDPPLKGAARGHLLAALTGLDLGGYDLRYVLLGLVEPGTIEAPIDYPRADRAVVSLKGGRRAWLDLHRGFVLRESVELIGGDLLLRDLKEYHKQAELYLPRRVEITQGDIFLALDYKSYVFNNGLEAGQLVDGVPSVVVRVP